MFERCSSCMGEAIPPQPYPPSRTAFPSLPVPTLAPVELGAAEEGGGPGRGMSFFFGLLVGVAGTVLLTDRSLMQRERMRWAAMRRR